MAEASVEQRVEQRVDQARKYVERTRGWRPQRRTVIYLSVMAAALVLSAVFVPRLLPGKLQNAETIVGHGGGISTVPLGGGAVRPLIAAPPEGEGYSTWAVSQSREEVAVGWFHESAGKVGKVTIQSRSAYSGRLQAEWVVQVKGGEPKVQQVGFLPQHNQIWFLAGGRLSLVDIKSGAIIDFPFRGPEGTGEIPTPQGLSYASFSPKSGFLAYAKDGRLTVVRGLALGRGKSALRSQIVMEPGVTADAGGRVVAGRVALFAWLDDETMAVITEEGTGASASTALYILKLSSEGASSLSPAATAPPANRFSGISRAPVGTDFAVLVQSTAAAQAGKNPPATAVVRYAASGKPGRPIELPAGEWMPPVSWTSP